MEDKLVEQVAKLPIWMPKGEIKRTVGTELAQDIISLIRPVIEQEVRDSLTNVWNVVRIVRIIEKHSLHRVLHKVAWNNVAQDIMLEIFRQSLKEGK